MATQAQRLCFNREHITYERGSDENWVNGWNSVCKRYGLQNLMVLHTKNGKLKIAQDIHPREMCLTPKQKRRRTHAEALYGVLEAQTVKLSS